MATNAPPELVVCVLMDCKGNAIACDHSEYGKEQNIGLHDVVSPVGHGLGYRH